MTRGELEMQDHEYTGQVFVETNGRIDARLNFDISSYQFSDLDLKIAVGQLPAQYQKTLILHLMGHRQDDIAKACNITRAAISKRLHTIIRMLANQML